MNELEYKEHINKQSEKVKTNKDLNKLIDEVTSYNHDYGTICHGIVAVMNAAFKVINASPQGGITGFQASCIAWELMKKFGMLGDGPARLIKYDEMLYPQYEDSFANKTITPDTWTFLQKKAKENLSKSEQFVSPKVKTHWEGIVSGKVPFGFAIKGDS